MSRKGRVGSIPTHGTLGMYPLNIQGSLMTKAEQIRMFEDLVPLEYAMKGPDRELFRRLLSRQKDDEDLDSAAREQLTKLHETYKPRKSREDLEDLWKKMTSGGDKS